MGKEEQCDRLCQLREILFLSFPSLFQLCTGQLNDPIRDEGHITDGCEGGARAHDMHVVCRSRSAYQQKGEGLRWLSTSTDASSFFTWLRMVDSLGPWITSASTSTCKNPSKNNFV